MPHVLDRFFGNQNAAWLKRHQKTVGAVAALENDLEKLTNEQIRERFQKLGAESRERLEKRTEDPLEALAPALESTSDRIKTKKQELKALEPALVEGLALIREAAKRSVGQRPFDVQVMGALALHEGAIAEMRTGEGKTLVAVLPLSLHALLGKGAHLITVNDYLARVGVETYGPVYEFLGLTVGVVGQQQASWVYRDGALATAPRKDVYACDITYGTNSEFGFDYLRDNMAPEMTYVTQRTFSFGIVDEVDSILIDEARTPLIISGEAEASTNHYEQFAKLVPKLKVGTHLVVEEKERSVNLTPEGHARVEQLLQVANVYEDALLAYHLEEALKAEHLFKRDKNYVVQEGEVIIVDEFTGRLQPGRRYSEGLHQAIEAKEGVAVQHESVTLATISYQNLFRLYPKLSGMTGTAATEAEEFLKLYGLEVREIPTNRPVVRKDHPDRIYKSEKAKFAAVVKEVQEVHATGQPILLGTASVAKNELLSDLLKRAKVPHEVLNAKNHAREAEIIALAGKKGAVTLATNMAGRGTDIVLGGGQPKRDELKKPEYEKALKQWEADHAEVLALGGLHVIGTERHESRRIDNQLRGRAGRQGDPGSSRFYLSPDDDLLRVFGGDRLKALFERLGVSDEEVIELKMISRSIESAQKRVEGYNFDSRKRTTQYDDVLNLHREVVYGRRRKLLEGGEKADIEVRSYLESAVKHESRSLVGQHASGGPGEWRLDVLSREVATLLARATERERAELEEGYSQLHSDAAIEDMVKEQLEAALNAKLEQFSESRGVLLRAVALGTIDRLWKEHLTTMDELRRGIGLRGYAQVDPLIVYKSEGYRLFQQLIEVVDREVLRTVLRVTDVQVHALTPVAPGSESKRG